MMFIQTKKLINIKKLKKSLILLERPTNHGEIQRSLMYALQYDTANLPVIMFSRPGLLICLFVA